MTAMLKDIITDYVKEHGFREVVEDGRAVSLWTRDEWKDWWTNQRTGEKSDREVTFDQLVMCVIYAEDEHGDASRA